MEVNITRSNPVNLLLLQSELKALIGDNFKGIATEPGIVRIILGDEVAGSVADSITLSVLQHDENAMTDYQAAIANAQTQVSETKANAKLVLDAYDTTISNAVGNWVNLDPLQKLDALADVVLKTTEIVRYLGYAAYNEMV